MSLFYKKSLEKSLKPGSLETTIIIIPNRRSKTFVKEIILSKIEKISISPEIYSIDDFVQHVADNRESDKTSLLFYLYESFMEISKNKDFESYHTFRKWANILLDDLNDIQMPKFRDYRVTAVAPGPLISKSLELLAQSHKPMVMAGTSLKWSEGGRHLEAFLNKTGIPCFVNGMARGEIAWDHPSFLSLTRKEALEMADLVILAGTPLDFRMRFGNSIPDSASIIQMDLDETLIGDNRLVDIGLVGNLGSNFEALTAELEVGARAIDFTTYRDQLRAREDELHTARLGQMVSDEVPIDPMRLCSEIAEAVTDEMIVIGDGGDIVAQASKVIQVPKNGTWMDPGPLGTLGVGMPFALAAQKAHPDKRVLIVYGDGSFGLNGFEYDTAVRFGLPIVGVLGNDAAWGQMMRPQAMLYGEDRLVAVELNRTRYDKVVEALGGHGEHVVTADEIGPAIKRAFESGKPALVNVEIRQDRGEMKGSTYV